MSIKVRKLEYLEGPYADAIQEKVTDGSVVLKRKTVVIKSKNGYLVEETHTRTYNNETGDYNDVSVMSPITKVDE
jgi:hypothetical protein